MINKIVQYKVKGDKLEIVLPAIKEFLFAVKQNEKETNYQAFQHNDKFSFTHFMSFSNEESEKKHVNSQHTKKFVEVLYPDCEKLPVFINLNKIDSK